MKREDRSETVTVRLTPSELRAYQKKAARAGVSVSEFMRVAADMDLVMSLDPEGWKMVLAGVETYFEEGFEKLRAAASRRRVRT